MSNSIASLVFDNNSFIFFCLCVCIYGHFLQSHLWYHLSRNPQQPIISLVYHKLSALEKDCSVFLLALNKSVFQPVWCNNELLKFDDKLSDVAENSRPKTKREEGVYYSLLDKTLVNLFFF
jgi:hypothetical protein